MVLPYANTNFTAKTADDRAVHTLNLNGKKTSTGFK